MRRWNNREPRFWRATPLTLIGGCGQVAQSAMRVWQVQIICERVWSGLKTAKSRNCAVHSRPQTFPFDPQNKVPELNPNVVQIVAEIGDSQFGKVFRAKISPNPQFSTNFMVGYFKATQRVRVALQSGRASACCALLSRLLQGVQNVFVRGPHRLPYSSSRAGHLT